MTKSVRYPLIVLCIAYAALWTWHFAFIGQPAVAWVVGIVEAVAITLLWRATGKLLES